MGLHVTILILHYQLQLDIPRGLFYLEFTTKVLSVSNFILCYSRDHVGWDPCHHGMARPQVADEGDALQFWREAANILNKQ
jgi:hypothetical protein